MMILVSNPRKKARKEIFSAILKGVAVAVIIINVIIAIALAAVM